MTDADAAEEVGCPQAHADRETARGDLHVVSVDRGCSDRQTRVRVATVVLVRIELIEMKGERDARQDRYRKPAAAVRAGRGFGAGRHPRRAPRAWGSSSLRTRCR